MAKKGKTPFLLSAVRWIFPRLERFAPGIAHRYFINVFFTPLRYPVPEKEKKAITFAQRFEIKVDGKKIQCYRWGEGIPMVLVVHGWAGRATQFRRFVKPLTAAGYTLVGFDGPAHGLSEGKRTSLYEFEAVLKEIFRVVGQPDAIIAHSFGGVATLFSIMRGLPVKRVINIASPTIGDEIIKTYLKAINGSWATGEFFKSYILKTEGRPFDEFSSLHFIKNLPHPVHLMLIHDENDAEVEIINAEALQEAYPSAILLKTKNLGHTRLLKDNEVIHRVVTFVLDGTSDTRES